jgi:hypothetical protein
LYDNSVRYTIEQRNKKFFDAQFKISQHILKDFN